MAEPSQNREDIIKIDGELRLIHQKLDNHITHMSAKIDTIFKIVWTVSLMDCCRSGDMSDSTSGSISSGCSDGQKS